MTYDEAIQMCERIASTIIGFSIRDKVIHKLHVGPTDWNRMCDYHNAMKQEGEEVMKIKFANDSFSVYGVNVEEGEDIPRYTMILLDNWEKIMNN